MMIFLEEITSINIIMWTLTFIYNELKNYLNKRHYANAQF